MPKTPVFMLKPLVKGAAAGREEPIASNRTITIIGDGDGPFDVLVTDRDCVDDPSGQTQTIIFKARFRSIDEATVEVEKQVDSSLAEGFIHNILGMI